MNPINEFGSNLLDLNKNLIHYLTNDNYYLDSLFSDKRNERIRKKSDHYSFLAVLNIVTPNDLLYGSCRLKLDFLRRNIHFNLYYQFQIDHFISNCNLIVY